MQNTQIVLIEQTLLNKVLTEEGSLFKLNSNDLISVTAKNIFTAIKNLHESNITLNSRNLTIEVNKSDNLDEQSIQSLFDLESVSDKSFSYLYNELRKEKIKHEIKTGLLNELIKETERKINFDPDRIQEIARDINSKILSLNVDKNQLTMNIDDMIDKYLLVLNDRRDGKMFYDTGCRHLNRHLMEGFAPQKITTLFGASGVGKSSYALYLVNKQINKQIPSVYISLEMDMTSTMDRLIAQRCRVNMQSLFPNPNEDNFIEDQIFEIVKAEKERLKKSKYFFFVEQPGLTLSDIDYIVKEVKSRLNVPYLICTIDLITMVRDFNMGNNKANDYEHALNKLHEMAKINNCHFLGVVQGRRPSSRISVESPEDLEKFRPRIEEIKNSAAFEERSRIILSTFRAKHYMERLLPDHPELEFMEDIMDIDVLKQNMGMLGRLHYLFNPSKSMIIPYFPDNTNTDNIGVNNDVGENTTS